MESEVFCRSELKHYIIIRKRKSAMKEKFRYFVLYINSDLWEMGQFQGTAELYFFLCRFFGLKKPFMAVLVGLYLQRWLKEEDYFLSIKGICIV
ncbi:hypothetical protein QGM71_15385 [Virgibacillus sp. C22-A2]|uniref:Uncharacterized protein n=1 Tax=Virgibacillus tibetensis TaxID=3042313 RepID=A0ABU6KI68_9BACI|nr:hypothetical protein [Virgibacillus sp. C22-A2]